MRLFDRNFRGRAPQYVFQCGLVTLSLIAILMIEGGLGRAAIVVAIASSAFIVFVLPNNQASDARKVIGGHLVAVVVGSSLFGVLILSGVDTVADDLGYASILTAALAVGISTFLMVITDTEHPPAAGTALGLIIPGYSHYALVFILSGALILSAMRFALRRKMVNLL